MRTIIKKKKSLKQYFAFALVLVMVATMIPLSAFAEDEGQYKEYDGFGAIVTDADLKVFGTEGGGDVALGETNGVSSTWSQGIGYREYIATPATDWVFAGWNYSQIHNGEELGNRTDFGNVIESTKRYSFTNSGSDWNTPYGGGNKISVNRLTTHGEVAGNPIEYKIWANFNPTINASANEGGTISDAGKNPVTYGTSKTYTITPNEGKEIDTVTVNGTPVGNQGTFTFHNVTTPGTIDVTFKDAGMIDPEKPDPEKPEVAEKATLTFNKGQFGHSEVANIETEVGKKVNLPAAPTSTKGYATFEGWAKEKNVVARATGNGEVLAPGTEITVDGDATYDAVWSINATYYVHKDKNLNLATQNQFGSKSVSPGKFYNSEELAGLDMAGKLTALPELSGQGQMKNFLPEVTTEENIAARYTEINNYIKTMPNENSVINAITGNDGKKYTLNWYVIKEEDNGKTIHVDGFLEEVTANQFTVTFEDGVNGTLFADVVNTVEAGTLTPNPPNMAAHNREGYKFTGWSPEFKVGKVNENLKYTAQWEKLEVSLSYDANLEGATAPSKETVKYGEEATVAAAPKAPKEYYVFEGWTAGDKKYTEGDKIELTANMELKAQWKIIANYYLHKDKNISLAKQNEYGGAGAAPVAFYQNHSKVGTLKAMPEMAPSSKNDKAKIYLPAATDDSQLANRYENVKATLGVQPDGAALVAELKAAGQLAKDKDYTIRWYVVKEVYKGDGKTRAIHVDGFVEEAKVEEHTVVYKDGVNGAAFKDQTYKVEHNAKTPAFEGTPTRTGYTFEGWSSKIADKVTVDQVYIAQWKAVEVPPVPPVNPPVNPPVVPPTPPVGPDDEGGADSVKPDKPDTDKPDTDDEGGTDSVKPDKPDTDKPDTDDEGGSDSADTDKNKKTDKDAKDNAVQTGDTFDIILWASIVVLTGILILALLAIRRKQSK